MSAPDGDRTGAKLRELAGMVDDRDRLMGRIARRLIALGDADDLHERLGGMTLQVWLEHHCRIPAPDARQLLGAVDVLARMPALLAGLCDGWVSWGQVAGICRAARRVRVSLLAELDDLVATAMVTLADCEPGAIVDDVWQWVDGRQPSRLEREERAAERGEFLSLQPRLTGGGSFYGEYGPANFATLAESVATDVPPPTTPHDLDVAQLRGDDLESVYDTLDERRRAHTRDHGAAMAARLIELREGTLAGGGDDGGAARRARPLLLATIGVDALCDRVRTPGWLLHTLAGGTMKVSAATVQRLVDERGADLRGIVLDECGQVVGVGRRTHVPPHWLRQAIWARDVAVTDPDGSCPIRDADLDHVTAWPHGPTDVDNLHPVGRRWHNLKTAKQWTVVRADDGTTTWTHRRHGWTLRLAPPRRDLATDSATAITPPHPPRLGTAAVAAEQPRLTGVP